MPCGAMPRAAPWLPAECFMPRLSPPHRCSRRWCKRLRSARMSEHVRFSASACLRQCAHLLHRLREVHDVVGHRLFPLLPLYGRRRRSTPLYSSKTQGVAAPPSLASANARRWRSGSTRSGRKKRMLRNDPPAVGYATLTIPLMERDDLRIVPCRQRRLTLRERGNAKDARLFVASSGRQIAVSPEVFLAVNGLQPAIERPRHLQPCARLLAP